MGIEEDLASRARSDREAYGQLFDIYFDSVYDFAYRINGSAKAAEFMTERIFYQVLYDIDSKRYREEEGSFRVWLFKRALSVPEPQEEYDDRVENRFISFDFETRKKLWIVYLSGFDENSIMQILNIEQEELERIKYEASKKVK